MMASALVACASDQPHERGRDHAAARPHGPQLFISPSGEPFRAGPDQPYPSVAWFARADTNHDGRLDRAEVRADATAFFQRLDANHDGVIDSFELGDYEQKVAPEILGAYLGDAEQEARPQGEGGRTRGGGRRGRNASGADVVEAPAEGGGYEGAAPFELTNDPEPVAAADFNVSGRITLDEFLRTVDRRFDEIDKAGRGWVAFGDLPLTPVQKAAKGGKDRRKPAAGSSPPG